MNCIFGRQNAICFSTPMVFFNDVWLMLTVKTAKRVIGADQSCVIGANFRPADVCFVLTKNGQMCDWR